MGIVLTVLGVAFGATCIWGIVRVVNEPKRFWLVATRTISLGTVVGIFMTAIGLLLLADCFPAVEPSQSSVAPFGFVCLIGGVAFVLFARPQG